MKDTMRRLLILMAVVLNSFLLLTSFSASAQMDIPGDGPDPGDTSDPQQGDSGSDGKSDSCVGECPGGDAGSSGQSGQSRKGKSAGTEGEQVTPAPTPTSFATGTPTKSGAASRTSGNRSSSSRSNLSSSIETILLYPETATPIPDPLPAGVAGATTNSDDEADKEQAASPVEEPVRETSSGSSPVRRTLGILAVLVAIGSAWSLVMGGKAKPGRRTMGKTVRRSQR